MFDACIFLVRLDIDVKDEEGVRIKEQSILALGSLLSKDKQVRGMANLLLPKTFVKVGAGPYA